MASGTHKTCAEKLLEELGLEKYSQRLLSQGYENGFDVCLLSEKDMDELEIMDPIERRNILEAAAVLDVEEWLIYLNLECYVDFFRAKGINTIRDVKNIDITDEILDSLEIMVPGHRKRVHWSATFLKWHSAPEPDTRVVVAGYWGKPPGLEGNQHPFLCVPGYLKTEPGEDAKSSEMLQFIVDSGSDVACTASESLIKRLDLQYLQEVESRGAHSAAKKPIYKGVLRLGSEEMEVEVMPENICSVGNVVMRKFKHYINGTYHRWLKEDPAGDELST